MAISEKRLAGLRNSGSFFGPNAAKRQETSLPELFDSLLEKHPLTKYDPSSEMAGIDERVENGRVMRAGIIHMYRGERGFASFIFDSDKETTERIKGIYGQGSDFKYPTGEIVTLYRREKAMRVSAPESEPEMNRISQQDCRNPNAISRGQPSVTYDWQLHIISFPNGMVEIGVIGYSIDKDKEAVSQLRETIRMIQGTPDPLLAMLRKSTDYEREHPSIAG